MNQVYGIAVLTIVAADSDDTKFGIRGVQPCSRALYQIVEEVQSGFQLAVPLPIPPKLKEILGIVERGHFKNVSCLNSI